MIRASARVGSKATATAANRASLRGRDRVKVGGGADMLRIGDSLWTVPCALSAAPTACP